MEKEQSFPLESHFLDALASLVSGLKCINQFDIFDSLEIIHSYSLCFRPMTRTFSWCHKLPKLILNMSEYYCACLSFHVHHTFEGAMFAHVSEWRMTVISNPFFATLKALFHQCDKVPTMDICGIFQMKILSRQYIYVLYTISVAYPQYLCL